MVVIADAGPIISFARSGHEDILRQVFSQLIIPEAVYDEIVIQGRGRPGGNLIQESTWIVRAVVQDSAKVDLLPGNLGRGEREAIILAEERNTSLLIDDRVARREAEKRGITCLGSLRVISDAKIAGFIAEAKPIVLSLQGAGLHISQTLYQGFLQEIGE